MRSLRHWTTKLLGGAALSFVAACSSVVTDPDGDAAGSGVDEGGEAGAPSEPSFDHCAPFAAPPTGAEICDTIQALGSDRTCNLDTLFGSAPPECEDAASQIACCLSTMYAEHGLELSADCGAPGEAFHHCVTGE